MAELCEYDLVTLSGLLARLDVSAAEVTEAVLARIERYEPELKTFITLRPEAARAAARESDLRRAGGGLRGPLDGVPIGLKDNIDLAGTPATSGMEIRRHYVPSHDAPCVTLLRNAGAVILGKHNMHEAAMGPSPVNIHYGSAQNPHRPGFTPGGSSTGGGAGVAARLCFAALGTDTGGSIRLPAAWSGVAGLKPTHGLTSTRGVLPVCFSFDVVGPLARTVRDLGLVMSVIAAYDPRDPYSRKPCTALDFVVAEDPQMKGIRLGRLTNVEDTGLHEDVRAAFEAAVGVLAGTGCEVRDVTLPLFTFAAGREAAFCIIRPDAARVHSDTFAREPEKLNPGLRDNIEFGRGLTAADIVGARCFRDKTIVAVRQALETCDALVLPTTTEPPYAFEARPPTTQADLTILANLVGAPAVSVPMGFTPDHLPLGLQIIGRPLGDVDVLRIARAYERAAAWDMRPQGYP